MTGECGAQELVLGASSDSQEHENLPPNNTRSDEKWGDIDSAFSAQPSASRTLQILDDIDPAGQYKVLQDPQPDLPRLPAPQASVSEMASGILKAIVDGFYDAEFERLERMKECAEFKRRHSFEEVPVPDKIRRLALINTPAGTSRKYVATCASLDVPKPDISLAASVDSLSSKVVVPGLEIMGYRPQKLAAAEIDGELANFDVDETTAAQIEDSDSFSQSASSAGSH